MSQKNIRKKIRLFLARARSYVWVPTPQICEARASSATFVILGVFRFQVLICTSNVANSDDNKAKGALQLNSGNIDMALGECK